MILAFGPSHDGNQVVAEAGGIWRLLIRSCGAWAGAAGIAEGWLVVCQPLSPCGLSIWLSGASPLHGGLWGAGPLMWSLGSVGGGHLENVTSSWPESSIRAIGGSSLLPLPYKVPSTHRSHSGSGFQGRSLERARCCWGRMDGIRDWTRLRPLYKRLIFWRAGEELYSPAASGDKPCM